MMIKILIAVLCFVSTNWAVAVAASETIELGPARISLELGDLGSFFVENGDTSSMVHKKPDFQYDISSASIKVNGSSHLVQIEVHRMSLSEPLLSPISKKEPPRRENISGLEHCLERSNMILRGEAFQTEPFTINGRQGFMATIDSDPENPRYIVAYSPDAQNGSGTTVCIIGSDFPWEATEKLFNSVEIELV